MSLKSVLVVGASGTLGGFLARGLLKAGFKVRVLARKATVEGKDNKATALADLKTQGAEIVVGDVTDKDSLVAATKGMDAVVASILGMDLVSGQLNLIEACKTNGVKRFIPSEFGYEGGSESVCCLINYKNMVMDALKKAGLAYTVVCTGGFHEVWMSPWLGIDLANFRATIPGDGNARMTMTSLVDIGNLFPMILNDPSSENATVYLSGEIVSYNQVVDSLDKAFGKKFERKYVPKEELKKQVDADPSFGTVIQQLQLVLLEGKGTTFENSWNKKHNHATMSIAQYCAKLAAPKDKVLVVGASGTLGSFLTRGLLAAGYSVRVMARKTTVEGKDNKAKALAEYKSHGAEIVIGDVTDKEAVNAACKGVDIVVASLLGADLVSGQMNLIEAAKANGCKRFIPSEFGFEGGSQSVCCLINYKNMVIETLKKAGLSYTLLSTGGFHEVWLSPWLGIDVANAKATIPGDGNARMSMTSLVDIGNLFPKILADPASVNATVHLSGDIVTYNQVVDTLEKTMGKKFQRTYVSREDMKKQVDADPGFGTVIQQLQLVLLDGKGTFFENTWNKKMVPHYQPITVADYVVKIANRPDPFRYNHKAYRSMFMRLLHDIGRVSYFDTEKLESITAFADILVFLYGYHSDGEDLAWLAELAKVLPEEGKKWKHEHEESHDNIENITRRLRDIIKAPESARSHMLQKLYEDVAMLVAGAFTHMEYEEKVIVPMLWQHFDDKALADMNATFVKNAPGPYIANVVSHIIENVNHDDRSTLVSKLKHFPAHMAKIMPLLEKFSSSLELARIKQEQEL